MRILDVRRPLLGLCLVALSILGATTAQSASLTVSAESRGGMEFRPVSTAPTFCARWPGQCSAGPALDLPIRYELQPGSALSVKAPSRRQVTVVHERSGEAHTLSFEVLAVGLGLEAQGASPALEAVQGGCAVAGMQRSGARLHNLWRVNQPAQPVPCVSNVVQTSEAGAVTISEVGLAYRLLTPSPLKMSTGSYHGQLTLSVGAGADLDLGSDVGGLAADSLTLRFELRVEHDFRIEFAQGSDQVVLEPPGGWEQWSQRLPQRLYRDVALRIWSSGPFSVHLRCQYPQDGRCGLRNQGNAHQVPLAVKLTLPSGFLHSGQSVNRVLLPADEGEALELESTQPMLNQGGVLHFEVDKAQVDEMARYPGMEYAGDVTVIFDAGM